MSWGLESRAERRSAIRFDAFLAAAASALLIAGATSTFSGTMSLPGQFSVSATGAATYTISIAIPSSTSGMTPLLSLGKSTVRLTDRGADK